jgi:hypothetical protein
MQQLGTSFVETAMTLTNPHRCVRNTNDKRMKRAVQKLDDRRCLQSSFSMRLVKD